MFREGSALRRLFDGLVEQVFMVDMGMCDTTVTLYLGELLADFVHVDRIYRLRTVDSRVIRDISEMEALANLGPDVNETRRRRLINKYIGDFTLFWTGLYPESLRPRFQAGVGRLETYLRQGKLSYGIASELTADREQPPAAVLQQLSEQFEYCVHGLQLVRNLGADWPADGGELNRRQGWLVGGCVVGDAASYFAALSGLPQAVKSSATRCRAFCVRGCSSPSIERRRW